jgi:hypothetical protein
LCSLFLFFCQNKFGSGYEIILQLDRNAPAATAGSSSDEASDAAFDARVSGVTAFVASVFPAALLLSANGGLLTYRVPSAELKVGAAFAALERARASLGLADYVVAQPTLEQV